MKRDLALVCVLVLGLGVGILTAQDVNRRDGNWWRTEAPPNKSAYMVGFFDGMALGTHFSVWKFTKTETATAKACFAMVSDSYDSYNNRFFTNVTNIQISAGLDDFYWDYRNRSILISDAVWLVVNSIAGTPKAELDSMIENWRRNTR